MSNELVHIKQLGDKYFVFNVKDVEKLRCQYRIVGSLQGTLPQFPLQNTFYGLPLLLLPEEVCLLVKKDFATVDNKISETLRSMVFEYFWSKGFYLTSGIKFGGDFLLYPGDPMCVHSEYIVQTVDSEEEIASLELVGMGRLATNVKKTFVLASIMNEMMTYYSIEWAGF
ncbi:tRNA intron endonuclease [Gilbertella persicaria]|uniref:tRNA intron endonuclease n=1 Tax=Gilbertella persicaria TaxID=101096 RepID=UPI002220D697|nr:tRNA intron endonuclease [Gilbertella persicaria]KAI8098098.1 tRNA intron endonuclease [Gilbertella persicaria]